MNPTGIFRIEPNLAGVVDWRDQVTALLSASADSAEVTVRVE